VKGLSFRIHGLAEKLDNLPVVKRAARRHFFFADSGSKGDDGSHNGDDSDGKCSLQVAYRLGTIKMRRFKPISHL
jgi:hypothetical protein